MKPAGYWLRWSGSMKVAYRRPTLLERFWMWLWNDAEWRDGAP